MKRSIMLIAVGVFILGISILGGSYLIDSESIEKTKTSLPIIESQEQPKSTSNNVKCTTNALGNMRCFP